MTDERRTPPSSRRTVANSSRYPVADVGAPQGSTPHVAAHDVAERADPMPYWRQEHRAMTSSRQSYYSADPVAPQLDRYDDPASRGRAAPPFAASAAAWDARFSGPAADSSQPRRTSTTSSSSTLQYDHLQHHQPPLQQRQQSQHSLQAQQHQQQQQAYSPRYEAHHTYAPTYSHHRYGDSPVEVRPRLAPLPSHVRHTDSPSQAPTSDGSSRSTALDDLRSVSQYAESWQRPTGSLYSASASASASPGSAPYHPADQQKLLPAAAQAATAHPQPSTPTGRCMESFGNQAMLEQAAAPMHSTPPRAMAAASGSASKHRRKRSRIDAVLPEPLSGPPPASATTIGGYADGPALYRSASAAAEHASTSSSSLAAAVGPHAPELAPYRKDARVSDDEESVRSAPATDGADPATPSHAPLADAAAAAGADVGGGGGGSGSRTKRRKRAILSCTECKQRKIKCDRNVPNCSSCVRRGVAHLCRWGDERDDMASTQKAITPSVAALMARIAQLESQVRGQQSSGPRPSSQVASSTGAASETDEGHQPASASASARREGGASLALAAAVQRRADDRSRDGYAARKADSSASIPKSPATGAFNHHHRHRHRRRRSPSTSCITQSKGDTGDDATGTESDADENTLEALARGTKLNKNRRTSAAHRRGDGIRGISDARPALTMQATHVRGSDQRLGSPGDPTREAIVSRDVKEELDEAAADAARSRSAADVPSPTQQQQRQPPLEERVHIHPRGSKAAVQAAERLLDSMHPFPNVELHEPVLGHRISELLVLLSLLPSREAISALLRIYISEAEPLVHALHVPTLWNQLAAFWRSIDRLDPAQTQAQAKVGLDRDSDDDARGPPDLQFAALLFALVEGACEYLSPAEVLTYGICRSRDDTCIRLTLLVRSSTALLSIAHFTSRPTLCGFQAVIALRHYCFNREYRQEYIVLYTMAIKAAEVVGIHRLGNAIDDQRRWDRERKTRTAVSDDASGARSSSSHRTASSQRSRRRARHAGRMPNGSDSESEVERLDPVRWDLNAMFLPPGRQTKRWELKATQRFHDRSHLQREVARKVWYALATLDWLCAAFFDRCYHCTDEQFTTDVPQNLDDEALIEEAAAAQADSHDSHAVAFEHRIQPWDVPTCSSFVAIHVDICRTVRSIADAMNQGYESYETVMQIDERFRNILDDLPPFYRLDGRSEYDPQIVRLHRARPYLALQRAVIHEYVYHRLLMLHRLFMTKGYTRLKYVHSTRTCVESSRVVLSLLRCLDEVKSRGQRYWIFKFHIFHALLALQMDLIHLSEQPMHDEVHLKTGEVKIGLELLMARTDAEGRNPILARSLDEIKLMRKEESERRDRLGRLRCSVEGPEREDRLRRTEASRDTGHVAARLAKGVLETWPHMQRASEIKERSRGSGELATMRTSSTESAATVRELGRSTAGGRDSAASTVRSDAVPPETSHHEPRELDTSINAMPSAAETAANGAATDATLMTASSGNVGSAAQLAMYDDTAPADSGGNDEPGRHEPPADGAIQTLDQYIDFLTSSQKSLETAGAPGYFDINMFGNQSFHGTQDMAWIQELSQPSGITFYGQAEGIFGTASEPVGGMGMPAPMMPMPSAPADANVPLMRPFQGFGSAGSELAGYMGSTSGNAGGMAAAAGTAPGGAGVTFAQPEVADHRQATVLPGGAGGWGEAGAAYEGQRPPLHVHNLLSGDP
ncbi:hypothetical protein ACQY0O_003959 [Thecaphora frezii]